MTIRRAGLVMVLAMSAGCASAPRLTLAPWAQPAPGQPGGAIDIASGVSFSAWPGRWTGTPSNLEDHVTPVLVRIENQSDSNILLRYDYFGLETPNGSGFLAIPPYALDATVEEPVAVRFPLNGFRVAPHLRRYYPRLNPWPYGTAFDVDAGYWSRNTTAWREIELPTADMVQMALPEGVVEPGGVVTGYVYFERVGGDAGEVSFFYRVVSSDHDELGRATVPFIVRS